MADIELVIKIPEDVYKLCQEKELISKDDYKVIIWDAIANGTPLPKGHGRIGDLDALRKEISSWGMNDYEPSDFIDAIDDAPTVEAIPKADYEARVKADMVAMLEDLDLRLEEMENPFLARVSGSSKYGWEHGVKNSRFVIQEKLNALRGKEDE